MSPRHIANGQQDEATSLYLSDLLFWDAQFRGIHGVISRIDPHHSSLDLIQFPRRIVIPRRIKSVEYVIGIGISDT